MFESRISAGATENYQGGKCLTQQRLRGPTTRKGMLKNACTKSQLLAWTTITSTRRNSNQWENCHKVCSPIVLKCLYLARTGNPDILWSVNKPGRANTCPHESDVQEANVSVSQFHRIGIYFVGCWFANGRTPCY